MAKYLDENGLLYFWTKVKSTFVKQVSGKGLSTNDYTTAEKTKLGGIETGANKYVHPTSDGSKHVPATGTSNGGKFLMAGSTAGTLSWGTPPNTTYSVATPSANGLMSSTDKTKLDGVAAGAEVNQNAFSNVKVGSTTVAADSKTDTLELVAGSNVTLTPDATNDKVTIAAKDTVYTHPSYEARPISLCKIAIDGTGHVSGVSSVEKSDITALGIPGQDTTYADMKGATASAAGTRGIVPAPAAGTQSTKYLRADGTWQTPPDTKYTHPSGDGNQHVPVTGTSNYGKFLMAGSKAGSLSWGTPTDTTYDEFKGATTNMPGLPGLVPMPFAGQNKAVLFGDCSWRSLSLGITAAVPEELAIALSGDGMEISRISLPVATSGQNGLLSARDKDKLTALPTAATLESTYAKKTDITGMYKYKGSVTDASKLPTTGQTTGDVYNIETASAYGGAGMNVAWNGSAWDPLGEIFTITSITNAQIDTICV